MVHSKVLEIMRKEIDNIDSSIIKLFAKRCELVRKVGRYKRESNIPYWQNDRVKEVIKTRIQLGKKLGLEEKFVKDIFESVIKFAMDEEQGTAEDA